MRSLAVPGPYYNLTACQIVQGAVDITGLNVVITVAGVAFGA